MISFQASQWSTLSHLPASRPWRRYSTSGLSPHVALITRSCSRKDLRIIPMWEVFDLLIVPAWSLKKRSCSGLELWIVPAWTLKRGCVQDWTHGLSPHGALKIRRCSGLDLLIVPAWSLKNEEVSRLDLMIVLAFCSGLAPHRTLKAGRCSKLDPNAIIRPHWESSCLLYAGFFYYKTWRSGEYINSQRNQLGLLNLFWAQWKILWCPIIVLIKKCPLCTIYDIFLESEGWKKFSLDAHWIHLWTLYFIWDRLTLYEYLP